CEYEFSVDVSFIRSDLVLPDLFGHFPMEHPLIGESAFTQARLISLINAREVFPHLQKLLLVFVEVLIEARPELFQVFFLFVCQVVEGSVEFLLEAEVFEQLYGINLIAVDLIEIAQQHFTPEIELVKWLIDVDDGFIYLMQVMHEFQLVGYPKRG